MATVSVRPSPRAVRADLARGVAVAASLSHPSILPDPYPRPTNGILVAMTVMVATLASRGSSAM
jgi:hypothetical protein